MSDANNLSEISDSIKNFIAQNMLYADDGFNFPDDVSFLQEGIIDSLGVMQLVEFVTKEFGINVEQREVTPENFDSVGKLTLFIQRKQQAKS